ncbi:MAG: nucleotidyl transferase AbiEii/AbiGii toxin family protein [bacterium]
MPDDLYNQLDEIRKLVIISLFSDDTLMELFTLKGGNALNYIYDVSARSSIDIDISMAESFKEYKLAMEEVSATLEYVLSSTFEENGYYIFDISLEERPQVTHENFWGGYQLNFKLLDYETWSKLKEEGKELEDFQRQAIPINEQNHRNFKVDISKYEYTKNRIAHELDYYTIYVYTPLMIVYEKLRSICQQMEEYKKIIPTHSVKGRAKDFFDIYTLMDKHTIKFLDENNLNILKEIFLIKKVPLSFLKLLEDQREFHRDSFTTVIDTINPEIELQEYDYYFDYVLEITKNILKVLGIK